MFDNFVTSFSPLSSHIWISISFYVAKFSLSFTWSSVLFDMLYIFLLQEHKSAKTVGEMKQYVQRIPFMQRAKSSLATRKEFKRMMLAFLFISFTSRDTPFLSTTSHILKTIHIQWNLKQKEQKHLHLILYYCNEWHSFFLLLVV